MTRVVLLVLLGLLLPAPAEGSLQRNRIETEKLPAWARSALARKMNPGEAAALVLHSELIVRPLERGGVSLERRVALRVVHDTALELIGERGLRYTSLDRVRLFEGWIVPAEGPAIELDREEDVVDVPCSESSIASDCRERVVSIPRIAVGSTLAYTWIKERGIDPGGVDFIFGDENWPTAIAQLVLELPDGWEGDLHARRAAALARLDAPPRLVLRGEALAAAPDLPRRPPKDEVLPLAWAHWFHPEGRGGFASWNEVGAWYWDLAEVVMAERAAARELAQAWSPASRADLPAALERIHDFVARDVRYTALYLPMGGYKPRPPDFVATKRFGDCKDKAYLVRALAEEWDLETYPVLVEAGATRPLESAAPSLDHFDHVIAAIELPEGVEVAGGGVASVEGVGRVLFVDATVGANAPPWTLASSYQGKQALLMTDEGSHLVTIPVLPPESSRRAIRSRFGVGNSGRLLEGSIVRTCTGDAAWSARESLSGLDDQRRARRFASRIQQILPGATISDFEIRGLDDPSLPLAEKATIKGGTIGTRVGGYLVIEPGRLDGGLALGDLPPPPRPWHIRLDSTRSVEARVSVELLGDWVPVALPEPWALETPELSASLTWRREGRVLEYEFAASTKVISVSAERYEAFRQDALELEKRRLEGVLLQRP